MPRYRFSQGKVYREDGIYRHRGDQIRGSDEPVVLIMVQATLKAFVERESQKEKELPNARHDESSSE